MGCTGKDCSKFVVFAVNVVFSIIGIVAVVVSIAGLIHLKGLGQAEEVTKPLTVVMILGIVVGSVVTLSACLGCFGAAMENKCILLLYVISLVVLIGLAGFAAYKGFTLDEAKLKPKIQRALNSTFITHPKEFHLFEKEIKCCGVNGSSDYSVIPATCCAVEIKGSCPIADLQPSCTEKTTAVIMQIAKRTAYVMVGLCVFEVLMIISAAFILTFEKSGRGTYFS